MNEIDVTTLTTVAECRKVADEAQKKGNLTLTKVAKDREYAIRITHLKTQQECENFITNARKKGREDLVKLIHQQSISLSIQAYPQSQNLREVEIECLKTIYAYEKVLSAKNGRAVHATYTWKAIKNRGILPAIDSLVTKDKVTQGFESLRDFGLVNDSFEAIVVKFPDSFSLEAVAKALQRLKQAA